MPRGWLKTALNRLRFVKAGYDADNLSLHPNNVIFDSGDDGSLSLVAAGSYRLTGWRTPGDSYVQIASWSLPFVPLCSFQYEYHTPHPHPYIALPRSPVLLITLPGGAGDGEGGTAPQPSMRVTASGIFFRGSFAYPFDPYDVTVHYQAYRLGV